MRSFLFGDFAVSDLTFNLEPGYKLEKMSRESNGKMCILVRTMRDGETAETHAFYESVGSDTLKLVMIINEEEAE